MGRSEAALSELVEPGRVGPTNKSCIDLQDRPLAGVPMVKHRANDIQVCSRKPGPSSPEPVSQWADVSNDFFPASLDFLPGCKQAVDKQAEKGNVHANEEHHVHDLVTTCPLIDRGCKPAYPSEDSFRILTDFNGWP